MPVKFQSKRPIIHKTCRLNFFIMAKPDSCFHTLLFLIASAVIFSGCKDETTKSGWNDYGGGPDQSKYVIAEDINKNTVSQLKVAWSYSTGDERTYQWNPIVIDTIMYVLAKNSSLVALNVVTGKEIWIHTNLRGITSRGINYWESKDRKDRRFIIKKQGKRS